MVFKKLTDEQKQKLFELRETHEASQISSMRALIMRGSSFEDAKSEVAKRQQVKSEYLEQLDKEVEARRAKEQETTAKSKKRKGKMQETNEPVPAKVETMAPIEDTPKPKFNVLPTKKLNILKTFCKSLKGGLRII